ncbi:MAG: M14 family metallopeptidase [Gemmatimonadota bacterium]
MNRTTFRTLLAAILLGLALPSAAHAQTGVTTPEQEFGHFIGADYVLPNYTQFLAYWQKLARESDRMVLDTLGQTAYDRPQVMAIITSPANHAQLERYRTIARRLARGEVASEAEARQLAEEGKAVVWFDGGLHATEVLGAQQLMETVYQLVSRTDRETLRLLDDLIILAAHANPDGMELVSDWYMRESDPQERSTGGIPVLYEKYAGHDNNRDFFASHLPETENINTALYRTWYPQIVYNHHQTGPAGTVMFAPPFRDPFNYNFDPLVVLGIDRVGSAMHERFLREGKPGVTMRSGASYSTWWNGGLRTTPYFKNMIGLLTETIGNPTPQTIPFIPGRQLPHGDLPDPIEPQVWHFRQSVDYSVTANYAVFDYASRQKDQLLFNIWRMGRNAIERGNQDSWTVTYRTIEEAEAELGGGRMGEEEFARALRKPEDRDPRGYILSADQPDFLTARKFMEALLEGGVEVRMATRAFTVAGTDYPAGSYVVPAAQAFAPHVFDMFEPQEHPDDIPYEGADPVPPYDASGWTLAYTMGVKFDRVLEGFDCPCEPIEAATPPLPAGRVGQAQAGWVLDHRVNDAFVALNTLLGAGHDVYWLEQPVRAGAVTYPTGAFFIPAGGNVRTHLETLARDRGLVFEGLSSAPADRGLPLKPVRVGLVDRYGGNMPTGWTQLILEEFAFPFELVYPGTLDGGNLNADFDVLVFVNGMTFGSGGGGGPDPASIPAEYRDRLGRLTREATLPRVREFMEAGGTVIAIGNAAESFVDGLELPVGDHMVDEAARPLSRSEFFAPGSVLEARLDTSLPITAGMDEHVDVFYSGSPVFEVGAVARTAGIQPIAWYDSATPLRSGWAWGQERLEGGVAALQAAVGQGQLYLFGPEIAFRAQPHGTFKFLFNGIYHGPAAAGR